MADHVHHSEEKFTAGTTLPYWVQTVPPISYQKLGHDIEVDVVVIGGGISGITVAYCLVQAGKNVALVEDGFIGSGETGRTTAHLVSALDDRYYDLERIFGEENTKLVAQSHSDAINFIERTIAKEKIDCEFERLSGYLFLHPSDKPENLEKEFEAAKKAGLDVEMTEVMPGINGVGKAIRFNGQGRFHPLKYLKGLCESISHSGGNIYTNTHAKEIDHNGVVTAEGFKIKATHVVVATNSPVNNQYAMHLRQYAYQTYVVGATIKKESLPDALWWDTGDFKTNSQIPPYHYVRMQEYSNTHNLLIVGGEDHPTGLEEVDKKTGEQRFKLLEEWAREHFVGVEEIKYRWSGEVMEPMDGLAFIGHNPADHKNVFIVTGDSGNGMTHGTIAGQLIRDLVLGNENELKKIYSPTRFKLFKSGKTFFKEFVGGLVNYLKTKPQHLDQTGLKDIRSNEGKIIEFEGKKFGAYRDENDNVHFVDAECTHLGCMVKWNSAEKSWDCPCHGSRFSFEGEVLHGPANQPLAHYSQNKNFMHNI